MLLRKQRDLTFRAGDAGASPRKACTSAAIHSLVNRASAAYGGVRAGLPSRWFLKWVGRCFAKGVVDFAQTSPAKVWENGREVGKKTPDCLSSVLVKQRF